MDASSKDQATHEELPPTDHLGIRTALLWLVLGSAAVATAIVAFGWKRTLVVWAGSGATLALLFVVERLWYRYVRKSE